MRLIDISIKSHFDSAHYLMHYDGQCSQLHGHRWLYEAKLTLPIQERSGIAIDFKELKRECKNRVEEILDHQCINSVIEQPTAENVCYWIFETLQLKYPELAKVSVWESPECKVSLSKSQFKL